MRKSFGGFCCCGTPTSGECEPTCEYLFHCPLSMSGQIQSAPDPWQMAPACNWIAGFPPSGLIGQDGNFQIQGFNGSWSATKYFAHTWTSGGWYVQWDYNFSSARVFESFAVGVRPFPTTGGIFKSYNIFNQTFTRFRADSVFTEVDVDPVGTFRVEVEVDQSVVPTKGSGTTTVSGQIIESCSLIWPVDFRYIVNGVQVYADRKQVQFWGKVCIDEFTLTLDSVDWTISQPQLSNAVAGYLP
jgi:hypothetical protein